MASPLRIPANVVTLTLTRLAADQESHKPLVTASNPVAATRSDRANKFAATKRKADLRRLKSP